MAAPVFTASAEKKKCDTTSTARLDRHSKKNIYSRNAEVAYPVVMQGISIDPDGSIWYTMLCNDILHITHGKPNKSNEPADAKADYVQLHYFGHGTNTAVERDGNDHYIWAGCYGANYGHGYWGERLIGRIKVEDGRVVPTDKCDEYYYFGNYTNVQPTVDTEHDQLAIQFDGLPDQGTVDFIVYRLSEAKKAPLKEVEIPCTDGFMINDVNSHNTITTKVMAHDLTTLTPIAISRCPWRNDPNITYHPYQGFDVNGDRIYFVEGSETPQSQAFLTVYDFNGNVVEERTQIQAVADTTFTREQGLSYPARFESEGVKVKGNKIYFGFSGRFRTPDDHKYYQTVLCYPKPKK
ncbi:MAG: hypothetical protein K2M65_03955 [Muribaculaceae bacterium]|nr:hypothetical protein [Muribaculaceae bacterium]